jgi:predicted phage tail protein
VEMVKWQAGRWMEYTGKRKQQVVDFSMGKS